VSDGGSSLVLPAGSTLAALNTPATPQALTDALATANDPASHDSASLAHALASGTAQGLTAALIALDAQLRLGPTLLPLTDRLAIDGRVLPRDGEALDAIVLPRRNAPSALREHAGFRLGLAAQLTTHPPTPASPGHVTDARLVWWGVAPAPLVAYQLAAVLRGRSLTPALIDIAVQTARVEVQPAGAGMELNPARLLAVEQLCREILTTLQPRPAALPGPALPGTS